MTRAYRLETKIHALNQLDRHEGDVMLTSQSLDIPARTLRAWRHKEKDLRRSYRQQQTQHLTRLKLDLLTKMLERGQELLERMDAETLAKAPLNQLASALSALVNHALKLEEAIDDLDEQEEKVIRFEYYYDDEVQDAPPWAGAGQGHPRAVQSGRLRETMGQNRVGQDSAVGERRQTQDPWMVAGANPANGGPGLARPEDERQQRRWYDD